MNIVVLISGKGSNLQAIIDTQHDDLPLKVVAVISNEPNAYGLERARKANIPAHIIDHRQFHSRQEFDDALKTKIDGYHPDLLVLAGFMRHLGNQFVNHYANKIINIHPSLLPKYPGLHTYQKVLENGDKQHGVSIHFVTPTIDGGPIIAQQSLSVHPDDTLESLKTRIQVIEHQLYPAVLKLFAKGRISIKNGHVFLDAQPIEPEKVR